MSDIAQWLTNLRLEKYTSAFADAEIEFTDLAFLTDEDLKEVGLPVGPRRRVNEAIKSLKNSSELTISEADLHASKQPKQDEDSPNSSSHAERRHLTVMFVDLVGSTEMATRMDAEDMRDVITSYQNTVAGVVSRYEGFVAKFMGDGVLCYFGWPRASEDDAERAVRAGLSIIEAVEKTKAPDESPLSTRVGIATGVVIVGDLIGSGATQEAAVVGETPNLAARLQGVAGLNQLVVAKETQRLLGTIFELELLDGQDLKGISGTVDAYRVIGDSTTLSRFAARQSGAITPIVGREREIEFMSESWSLARSGHAQMVLVSGEAGIGKSRITQALIDMVAQQDHIQISYQCSPYHADSAFYPVIQHMSLTAGFVPSDTPDERLDKLEVLLGDDQDTLRLVAPLLGLDIVPRYGELDLTPAQQRVRTMRALAGQLVRLANDKPVLMVFEDLHWVDPTSLEFLKPLLDAIIDQRIMILATARPSFEYEFGDSSIVSRIVLKRLGKEQINGIVHKLTGGRALPDELMEIIAQRTDGVPLFVEELSKTILESDVLKEEGERLVLNGPLSAIAIPATLHDSLMARLDRLQPIKEVAQTAACIGREFTHQLLAQICDLSDTELSSALEGLIASELIQRRGQLPEASYLFKHALVRDAAYESLLRGNRREIHSRILSALETDADTAPEVLAVHAEAAQLTDRAIDLWETASKAAIARPAFDEAISHLRRAIALITPALENSDNPPFERALTLIVPLSMTLLARKGFGADEPLESFKKALAIADKVGESSMRYSILYGLWIGTGVRGQYADALLTAEALVEETANAPGTPPMVVANRVAGVTHHVMGNFTEAQRYLDIAMAHYDPIAHVDLANEFGQDIGVTIHIWQAYNLGALGQTRQVVKHLDEAESRAKSTGHIPTICYALMLRTNLSLKSHNRADAERCLNELVPIAQEHNLLDWLGFSQVLAELLAAQKGDKTSIARYRKAEAAMISVNHKNGVTTQRVDIGWSALSMGLHEEAAELAFEATEMIDETGENNVCSEVSRLQAAIAKVGDDAKTAEKHLVSAIDIARRQGGKYWELLAAIDLAQLWQEQDRYEEANSLLGPILGSIAEGDCPIERAKAQAMLVELAT